MVEVLRLIRRIYHYPHLDPNVTTVVKSRRNSFHFLREKMQLDFIAFWQVSYNQIHHLTAFLLWNLPLQRSWASPTTRFVQLAIFNTGPSTLTVARSNIYLHYLNYACI